MERQMKIIIAGASGFIGRALTKKWTAQGNEILAVGRSKKRLSEALGTSVKVLDWQDIAEDAGDLVDTIDVIVNLAGAGVADGLWTKDRKKEILQSRVKSTQTLAAFAAKGQKKKRTLLNASAIGIYGLHKNNPDGTPLVFDEHAPVGRGQDSFLAQVCRQWEEETKRLSLMGVRVVNLRFGMILSPKGGALKKMIPPFQ